MKKLLVTAVAATLSAPAAYARPRQASVAHVNPPSRAASSGASPGAPASGAPAVNQVYWGTPPPAGATSVAGGAQPSQSRVVWGTPIGGARGFSGGGSAGRGFNSGSYWGRGLRRDTGGGTGGAGSAPTGGGETIPSVLMAGQLIRTAGLGALMSAPDAPPSMFAYEAGPIRYEESKGINLTNHVGLFTGPKDTPPPTNKIGVPGATGGGSGAGGNGITENNNVQFNSHSNNGNGNGTGGGNGQGN